LKKPIFQHFKVLKLA